MSIAELIMTGTQQASKSTDWVADSLAKIGDNVTKVLREREQNRQAQEILPMLQQGMQESMTLAQKGDTAAAYSNMIGILASNPNLLQNNRVLPVFDLTLKGINESAERYKQTQDYNQRQAYYDKVTANKTGGGGPSVDAPRYGFGNISSVDNETITPLPVDFSQLDEMPQTTGAGMPAFTGGFSAGLNEPVQEGTPAQQAGRQNVEEVLTLPPEQQKQATMSFGITNFNPDQYEVQNIAGLSKYLPDFVGFAVPKETWKETTATLSGKGELSRNSKLTAPEARENFTKDGGTKANVEKAIRTMSDKTMTKLFNDFGKDIYALRASTDQRDDPRGQGAIFTVTGKDGKDIKITQDQYAAIETIAGITPAVAENAGGTPAIFKPSGKTLEDKYPVRKTEEPTQENTTALAQPTPPPKQGLTLEQQVQQELSGAKQTGKTVTPQQTKTVEQSRISSQKSNLESEKRRLENLIYTVQRASGKKTLKAGITKETEAKVKAEVDKINKQLASL
jgi:hypothetical protein